ncbi:MAG: hypothetical protein K0Q74_1676, partial [Gammaproteobacteria bacterium]|nr:hypothetical protein [Gammaproteobacteria bacterium]
INQVATNKLATDEESSYLQKNPSQMIPISKLAHSGTPLHYAVSNLQKEVIEFLIANGAHLNVKNAGGFTPQDLAKKTGAEHIIRLLENPQTQKGIATLAGKVGLHAQQGERPLGGNIVAANVEHNANHQGFKQVVAPGPTMS